MHITIRQLQVFQQVAELKSFTHAADALHLTQPGVSIQVKQLEQSIGLPVFEKIGKRIYLTEAGEQLLHCSRNITMQLEEAAQVFSELRGAERGRLRIAVASTANYFASYILAEFARLYPQASISLDVANREELLEQLECKPIDMAIMGKPPENSSLVGMPFMSNPLVVIASPAHPLAQRKNIPLQELSGTAFVVREQGSGTHAALERFFGERKLRYRIAMEMTSNEAIKQAVTAGLGLGIVSLHTVELELLSDRLKLLDINELPIGKRWYIVQRQDKNLSPIAMKFRTFILERAGEIWNIVKRLEHKITITERMRYVLGE